MSGYIRIGQMLFDQVTKQQVGYLDAVGNEQLGSGSSSSAGVTLLQANVPVGVAPSGTVTATGALTLTTALLTTYNTGVYLYFPAGALTSAAGFYWVVMTTTTAGQVYTAQYTTGVPTIPATLANATGSNTAYASAANLQGSTAGINTILPANVLGPNGILRYEFSYTHPGAAAASVLNLYLGSTIFYGSGNGSVSNGALINATFDLYNRGSVSVQGAMRDQSSAAGTMGNVGAGNLVMQASAINTALAQVVCLNPWVTAAGDGIVMEKARIVYFPAN